MSDRPLEDYSLPYLWKRIAELEAKLANFGGRVQSDVYVLSLLTKIDELEATIKQVEGELEAFEESAHTGANWLIPRIRKALEGDKP